VYRTQYTKKVNCLFYFCVVLKFNGSSRYALSRIKHARKKCEEHYLITLLEKRNCPGRYLLEQSLQIKAAMTVLT